MSRKDNTSNKALQSDALLIFNTIHDKATPKAIREEIGYYADDVLNISPLVPDLWSDRELFVACFVDGMKRATEEPYTYSRDTVREIVESLKKGETPEEIIARFNEARKRVASERLNAPEPKDKSSNDWRVWKVRQLERAFNGTDAKAYDAAWTEYQALLRGLVSDRQFYHVSYALALLPHLLAARQEIDATIAREKRSSQKRGGKK
ncbi:MAG TPA: hypothetical protein VF543_22360 [Pyrinomonadaceae bacterium]|jgi:hypothetical protein